MQSLGQETSKPMQLSVHLVQMKHFLLSSVYAPHFSRGALRCASKHPDSAPLIPPVGSLNVICQQQVKNLVSSPSTERETFLDLPGSQIDRLRLWVGRGLGLWASFIPPYLCTRALPQHWHLEPGEEPVSPSYNHTQRSQRLSEGATVELHSDFPLERLQPSLFQPCLYTIPHPAFGHCDTWG